MLQPSILVTGATGLLGRACLSQLIARYGVQQIAALVRRGRDTTPLRSLGIAAVEIELCVPGLGLSNGACQALAASVNSIIHCAADIRFNVSLKESRQVNVLGTENLLRFAASCPRLNKFAHMSTVYVSGGRSGHITERPAEPGSFFNPYQSTKFEAEGLVLEAMARLPATIYRFSTMIYDRTLDRVAQFNYFHQLLRLALVNPLQTIPALRDAKVDLIPSDWAARIFDLLFEEHWKPGEIVHICAGRENSLTVGELFDITFDFFANAGSRPEIVSLHEFNKIADAILTTPSRRQMWQSLSQFLPHMNVDQTFDCTRLTEITRLREDLNFPDMRQTFRDVLAYCIASSWGCTKRNDCYCSEPPQLDPGPAVQPKQ
jgi:long-chain acyl-CoA synthetase